MAFRHPASLALCFLVVYLSSPVSSQAGHYHAHDDHFHDDHHHHEHDHDHDHAPAQPASFKYSKQANQQAGGTRPAPQVVRAERAERAAKAPAGMHSNSARDHTHDHAHGQMHAHSHGAHSHSAQHAHNQRPLPQRPRVVAPYSAWLNALGSTLAISLAPFLILFFIPIEANDAESQPLLRIFLAFASGSLLGDAFLHLIPHAVPGHSHSHSHTEVDHHHGHTHIHEEKEEVHDHFGHTIVGLWVLAGIISFLIVEKVIRHIKGAEGHSHGHSHGQSHGPVTQGKIVEKRKVEQISRKSSEEESQKKSSEEEDYEVVQERKHAAGDPDVTESMHVTEEKTVVREFKEKPERVEREEREKERDKEVMVAPSSTDIKVGGYLNFAADFAHNFTDGLAIGASFLVGQNIGWITTFTILFHEIPHEIGDFALLVQSGCSKKKAMLLQLVTAIGAFMGCLVSLIFGVSDTEDKTSPILAFTAGGFIYIATVSVIPELLMESKISQSLMEIAALLFGIAMMVVIAVYE